MLFPEKMARLFLRTLDIEQTLIFGKKRVGYATIAPRTNEADGVSSVHNVNGNNEISPL
jgi:hypothetical protein